jgi:hypothetical protein
VKKRERRTVNHICLANDYYFELQCPMMGDGKFDFIFNGGDVDAGGDECEPYLCAGAHGNE